MPRFLEVYGYYDNELESWAIEVSRSGSLNAASPSDRFVAYSATAHLKLDDDRDIYWLSSGRPIQQQVRDETRALGRFGFELHRHSDYAWHHKHRRALLRTPLVGYVRSLGRDGWSRLADMA